LPKQWQCIWQNNSYPNENSRPTVLMNNPG
jgi:hypothetical protein